jgi:hypothetical protein
MCNPDRLGDSSVTKRTVFCDGIHDGNLIVNMAGFSDPEIIKPGSQMLVLIRGSSNDARTTAPMEIRKLMRAYQWQFPIMVTDANDMDPQGNSRLGKIDGVQLTPWICKPSQFSDGICDCNCGRADWDCMGDQGIPEIFVKTVLEQPNAATTNEGMAAKAEGRGVPRTDEEGQRVTCQLILSDRKR